PQFRSCSGRKPRGIRELALRGALCGGHLARTDLATGPVSDCSPRHPRASWPRPRTLSGEPKSARGTVDDVDRHVSLSLVSRLQTGSNTTTSPSSPSNNSARCGRRARRHADLHLGPQCRKNGAMPGFRRPTSIVLVEGGHPSHEV